MLESLHNLDANNAGYSRYYRLIADAWTYRHKGLVLSCGRFVKNR